MNENGAVEIIRMSGCGLSLSIELRGFANGSV